MNLTITKSKAKPDPNADYIDKRVYVPGVTLHDTCPECKEPWMLDLATRYVAQYPVSGAPLDVDAYCQNCEHEWVAGQVAYTLTVEIAAPQ